MTENTMEKNAIVQKQFKITIPNEIRNNINVKIGDAVKWSVKKDSIETGEVTLKFVNI